MTYSSEVLKSKGGYNSESIRLGGWCALTSQGERSLFSQNYSVCSGVKQGEHQDSKKGGVDLAWCC